MNGTANRITDALDSNTCPTCGVDVGSRRFFCGECWRAVPDLLRSELREAARERSWKRWIESAVAAVRAVEAELPSTLPATLPAGKRDHATT